MLMKTTAGAYTKPMTALVQKPTPIYIVHAFWDDEVKVWCATSSDVPGLVTEADTLETLAENLQELVPMMLQLNGEAEEGAQQVTYEILARRFDTVPMLPPESVASEEPAEA